MRIGCEITSESSVVIDENLKNLKKLREISQACKKDIKIGDAVSNAIFNNTKYLTNLEKLILKSKKDKN